MQIIKKAAELSADFLEPLLDSLLQSGFLKEIPLLGAALKLADLKHSISDRIYVTKVVGFLQGLETAASAEEFAEQTARDEETRRRAGESVMLSLDAMNDLEKGPLLACVFLAHLRNEIGLSTLRRLNSAVNLAMVDDLWALAADTPETGWDEEGHGDRLQALHALRITGLTALSDHSFQLIGKRSFSGTEVTELGKLLIKILRNSPDYRKA